MKQLTFLILILSIFTSCRKAGLGGTAALSVYPEHHGKPIVNREGYPDSVWIKFNSDELPGLNPIDFDACFTGITGEEFVLVEGIKPGHYYVYVTGYDSTGPFRVKGGMPFRIKYSDRKNNFRLVIPVTE